MCVNLDLRDRIYDASRGDGPSSYDPCNQQTACTDFQEACNTSTGTCRSELEEEYGREDVTNPFPATHYLVRVIDDATDEVVWGWGFLDEDGCTGGAGETFPSDATTFRIEYTSWSKNPQSGNSVIGYTCDPMPTCQLIPPSDVDTTVTTNPGGTTQAEIDATNLDNIDAPVWSASFSDWRHSVAVDSDTYVLIDDGDLLDGTNSSFLLGDHPTVRLVGQAFHSKFKMAHEYGHIQLLLALIGTAAGFHPKHLDYDYGSPSHDFATVEWSAAAAVEGFAHMYALAVWHDVDTDASNGDGSPFIQVDSSDADRLFRAVPRGSEFCIPSLCPDDGTSNEHDWVTALWHFRTDSGTQPTFSDLFGMLEAVHTDGCSGLNQATCSTTSGCTWDTGHCLGWPANGADDDFWTQFDDAMSSHLSGALQTRWDALAQTWELDD